ncbi:MAG TPA: Mov34/MPN/PAD-1 family protein [Gemmataceae bacterium]|jgi:proteasome lid subunit RPN8/RPN11|nr:Mov34/MPN/PAD-1 family protein [Gemmataceae bacterium]
MLQVLVSTANQLLADLNRSLLRERKPAARPRLVPAGPAARYQPLQRVLLTDGVGRTLFEEYAAHRAQARGEEETGWVLMGLREVNEAIVLATLPAGAERDASVAHVRFNSRAQEVGSRIVRQSDRRLTILGVVHTHPGSLRHPSDADYRGDHQWVRHVRGGEGVFGIGTADGEPANGALFAWQPRPHVQCLGELSLSWYALRHGDPGYRPLPVGLTIGPDLARALHSVWTVIERHADQLDRLYRQQAGVTFHLAEANATRGLIVNIPLAEPNTALRVLLAEDEVRYYLVRDGELLAAECQEDRVDRGVYLLLAELAAPS